MISYAKFRRNLNENIGVLDRKLYQGHLVIVDKSFNLFIDNELVAECCSLIEANEYARSFINNLEVISESTQQLPVEKVVELVREHHDDIKITDSLIEEYLTLDESKRFSLDPVLLEMKASSKSLNEKLEYILEDGNIVAISEETVKNLSSILEDKYQIVEYMQKCKDNFMQVLRKLS